MWIEEKRTKNGTAYKYNERYTDPHHKADRDGFRSRCRLTLVQRQASNSNAAGKNRRPPRAIQQTSGRSTMLFANGWSFAQSPSSRRHFMA